MHGYFLYNKKTIMKYTLQEVQEMLNTEIRETKIWTLLMIQDDMDNDSLYETELWLTKTKENLDIIFSNLIEWKQ